MKIEIEHVFLAAAAGLAVYLWQDSLAERHILTKGSTTLQAAIPYRFTYQTTNPFLTSGPSVTNTANENKVRLLLVPSSAYAIEFKKVPGLVGGQYLVSFTAMPPHDTLAAIGTPLVPTPSEAFDLKLARIERLDGKAIK